MEPAFEVKCQWRSELSQNVPLRGKYFCNQLEVSTTHGLNHIGDTHGSGINAIGGFNRHGDALEWIIVTYQKSVFA